MTDSRRAKKWLEVVAGATAGVGGVVGLSSSGMASAIMVMRVFFNGLAGLEGTIIVPYDDGACAGACADVITGCCCFRAEAELLLLLVVMGAAAAAADASVALALTRLGLVLLRFLEARLGFPVRCFKTTAPTMARTGNSRAGFNLMPIAQRTG